MGIWGYVIYAGLYAVCTVCMVPGFILTLAAGVIFEQVWQGFIVISAGSTIGASLAFLLGSTVMRKWVEKKISGYKIFAAIDRAIRAKGFFMVLLLRLSPAIPFNVLNYALSLTGLNFFIYALASWIGMAPGTFMYVYVAWAAKKSIGERDNATFWQRILTYVGGGIATITVVVLVTYFARKEILKVMKEQETMPSLNDPSVVIYNPTDPSGNYTAIGGNYGGGEKSNV